MSSEIIEVKATQVVTEVATLAPVLTHANTDDQMIALWLHDVSENSRSAYSSDVRQFREFLRFKPLPTIVLEDLHAYSDYLVQRKLKDSSRKRKLNSIKSLFTFATKLNYLRFNIAAAMKMPKSSVILAQRILKPRETARLVHQQTKSRHADRNRIFVLFLYVTGVRVSEACSLHWTDFLEQTDGQIQAVIRGKGGKIRQVLIPLSVWEEVRSLKPETDTDDRVFGFGRKMAHLIVKQAVEAANLSGDVSAHWLRHAHAQHSLKNGAPLELVRDSLGHSSIAVTNWYLESMPEDSSSKYLGF